MRRKRERDFNNRLLDRIIGGSYLGAGRKKFFAKLKNIGIDSYAHILVQIQKLKDRYQS